MKHPTIHIFDGVDLPFARSHGLSDFSDYLRGASTPLTSVAKQIHEGRHGVAKGSLYPIGMFKPKDKLAHEIPDGHVHVKFTWLGTIPQLHIISKYGDAKYHTEINLPEDVGSEFYRNNLRRVKWE